ncbi:MAG TPA: hypothetical protein VF981_14420 [Gemmatimonadaceae bacterium]
MDLPPFAGRNEPIGAETPANTVPIQRPARLRFASFSFQRQPSGRGTAEVVLEKHDGTRFVGRIDGVSSAWADLRLAAEATLRAIAEYNNNHRAFELVGVKSLRAFDANVVMVSVVGHRDGKAQQLLGCRIAEGDQLRSAVLATLQATNRVMSPGED